MSNADRVYRADHVLRLYAELEGSEAYEDDTEALLCDLLTDLRHWANENELDFDRGLNMSEVHYIAEKEGYE